MKAVMRFVISFWTEMRGKKKSKEKNIYSKSVAGQHFCGLTFLRDFRKKRNMLLFE